MRQYGYSMHYDRQPLAHILATQLLAIGLTTFCATTATVGLNTSSFLYEGLNTGGINTANLNSRRIDIDTH